jgi:hypothetical protein
MEPNSRGMFGEFFGLKLCNSPRDLDRLGNWLASSLEATVLRAVVCPLPLSPPRLPRPHTATPTSPPRSPPKSHQEETRRTRSLHPAP